MEPRISFVTLGVSDLQRSARFYREVLKLPQRDTPPTVCFFEMGSTWLALYPRELLAEDAEVSAEGSGFAGFTIAHNVRSEPEVDALLAQVAEQSAEYGCRVVRAGRTADWGGYTGYFADPDGFLWEVAWNPAFPHV